MLGIIIFSGNLSQGLYKHGRGGPDPSPASGGEHSGQVAPESGGEKPLACDLSPFLVSANWILGANFEEL